MSSKRMFAVAGVAAAMVMAGVYASAAGSVVATARASLVTVPGGQPAGFVQLSEHGSGYLGTSVNLSGRITGLTAGQPYGVHLYSGTCASLGSHVRGASQFHPAHAGDLPNVVPNATGAFSITRASNRFTLSNQPGLHLGTLAGGPVAVVVDTTPDSGGAPGTAYACGSLVCGSGCVP